jgi:hypothetical protein
MRFLEAITAEDLTCGLTNKPQVENNVRKLKF